MLGPQSQFINLSINTQLDNYELRLYSLIPKKKDTTLPKVILSEIDNKFNYRGNRVIYTTFLNRSFSRHLLSFYRTKDIDQIFEFVKMHNIKNKAKSNYGDSHFLDLMEEEVSKIYEGHKVPLIMNNFTYTSSPLCMRVTNLSDTKTALPIFDLINNIVSQLGARDRAEINKYVHPFNPYTWHTGIYNESDPQRKMQIQNQNNKDNFDRPPFLNPKGETYYTMKSSEMVREYSASNENLAGSIRVLAEQSRKKDTRSVITPTELITFMDQMIDNIPVDEYGLPIEIQPPYLDKATLVAHGPKSTAGGVDIKGNRQTKTVFYHSSINNALDLMQAMKNRSNYIDEKSTQKTYANNINLMPLLTSTKNEITKKKKKIRFFTLVPAQFEMIETIVYSQILDNNHSVTYSLNGGNRLMIGNSLDRGYGSYLLNTMLIRNREDLEGFNAEIKKYDGRPMKNYNEHGATIIEKAKSFVTDYTSQEFQHNSIHRLLSQTSLYHFYTAHPDKNAFQMAMATIAELTLQVDADLGGGKILILPPGHVASGCKMTLTGNGQSNKYELTHAADEALVSIKRGYYYTKDVTKCKNECYNQIPITENYCLKTILKVRNNTLFQGDDGSLVTIDGDPKTFDFIILIMREMYSNQIKADVKNALAVHDEQCYDTRDAGDFLKLKPTITKKGVFYIRDTAAALQKMFYPNTVPYNAVTQLFAAISQSYTSNGNYYSYKLAMIKVKMLAKYIADNKINVTEDDKNDVITLLQSKADVKNNAIIETLILNGFMELDFNTINRKFLQAQNLVIIGTIEEAKYYHAYGIRQSMLNRMNVNELK